MSPTLSTFLLEAVNFLLLAGLLGFVLFKPVRQALERKRRDSEQQAADAAAKLAEAKRLQDEAREERASLERDLEARREEAVAQARAEAEAILDRARETAKKERERARAAVSNLSEAEWTHLADAVADAAGRSVGELLTRIGSKALERELVSAACRELGSLSGSSLGKVVVETARPLDDDVRREVEAILGDGARDAEFRVLPALGSGIRITTSRGLIDASTGGLATYARRALADTLINENEERS